ncbi:MAG: FAD-dependent oxidoreductase [Eubacteriales bacterium]|jgi:uncharacterized FAD-dependent dehydrogenase
MIRISQLKLPVLHAPEDLKTRAASLLHVAPEEIRRLRTVRRSIDARDRSDLRFVYTVDLEIAHEKKILSRVRNRNISAAPAVRYHFPKSGTKELSAPPVIVGSGPAGFFAAWMLARHGYRPVLLERGDEANVRKKKVEAFWKGQAPLDLSSNVQFGEGGAGTFSDGKLNTGVHDREGRKAEVLRLFVKAGAPADIMYDAKPHIGTDLLVDVVRNLRAQILSFGGEVHFRSEVTDFMTENGRITGVRTADGTEYRTEAVILAIGHSARDTFTVLSDMGIPMEPKPFAVGLRVQHPQDMINRLLYGEDAPAVLGAAPYKLTHTASDGRGVYSFCMCPGGYIVNASSEEGRLTVNGMSLHDRASGYANSAIVTAVRPEDYAGYHISGKNPVLDGMYFQQYLEEKAFAAGEGEVPFQRLDDFEKGLTGTSGLWQPCVRGPYRFAGVHTILPGRIRDDFLEGMHAFGHMMEGFDHPETLLAGVESRTSSPVRILRDENFESAVRGLYPAGEGAGYAGGIMSAAMDGIRTAEKIAENYRAFS